MNYNMKSSNITTPDKQDNQNYKNYSPSMRINNPMYQSYQLQDQQINNSRFSRVQNSINEDHFKNMNYPPDFSNSSPEYINDLSYDHQQYGQRYQKPVMTMNQPINHYEYNNRNRGYPQTGQINLPIKESPRHFKKNQVVNDSNNFYLPQNLEENEPPFDRDLSNQMSNGGNFIQQAEHFFDREFERYEHVETRSHGGQIQNVRNNRLLIQPPTIRSQSPDKQFTFRSTPQQNIGALQEMKAAGIAQYQPTSRKSSNQYQQVGSVANYNQPQYYRPPQNDINRFQQNQNETAARDQIIEALEMNQFVKLCIRDRILQLATESQIVIQKFLKRRKEQKIARNLRKNGYFRTNIYLESENSKERIKPTSKVVVFGEFSEENPWRVKVQCNYDEFFKCFKAYLTIKKGHQFKFEIDNGAKYITSSRYSIQKDKNGFQNNSFQPKQINWSKNEKKKPRNLKTQQRVFSPRKNKNILQKDQPNYIDIYNLTTSQKPSPNTPQDGQNSTARQKESLEKNVIVETSNFIQIQKPIQVNNKFQSTLNSDEKLRMSKNLKQKNNTIDNENIFSRQISDFDSKHSTQIMQNGYEQIKIYNDFRDQFEEFFRGDSKQKKNNQSGQNQAQNSSFFKYNEEEEYFENLRQSGSFCSFSVQDSKKQKLNSSITNKDTNSQTSFNANSIMSYKFQQELEIYKNYDNIFDLQLDDENTVVSILQFNQLSLQNMHKKFNQNKLKQVQKKNQSISTTPPNQNKKQSTVPTVIVNKQPTSRKSTQSNQSTRHQTVTPKNISNKINFHNQNEQQTQLQRDTSRKYSKIDGQQSIQKDNKFGTLNQMAAMLTQKIAGAFGGKKSDSKIQQKELQEQSNQISQNKETVDQFKPIEYKPQENIDQIEIRQSFKNDSKIEDQNDKIDIIIQEDQKEEQNLYEEKNYTEQKNQFDDVQRINSASPKLMKSQLVEVQKIQQDQQQTIQQPEKINLQKIEEQQENKISTLIQIDDKIDKKYTTPDNKLSIKQDQQKQAFEYILQDSLDAKNETSVSIDMKIKATSHNAIDNINNQNHERALSEISFFYEHGEEDDSDENEDQKNPSQNRFILIQGAHRVGKAENQCEDAYFIHERAFGVSDGVSGWNDYGFSSDQFSLQLMMFSKQSIQKNIKEGMNEKKEKKFSKSMKSRGVKRNKSLLSMDNLEIEENEDEDDEDNSSSSKSSNYRKKNKDSNDSDSSRLSEDSTLKKLKSKRKYAERTVDHIIENELDTKISQKTKNTSPIIMSLEEEIQKKLSAEKITQEQINDLENQELKKEGQEVFEKNITPSKQMKLDSKKYDVLLYPTYILQKAFQKVTAVGSATALIAILNKNELQICNIGDSGFLVIRFKNGEPYVPHKSKEQQHSFNIPYQLSQLPTQADLEILRKMGKKEEVQKLRRVLRKKNNVCQDSPENADDYSVPLKDGDIIVSATDGVLDNLFQHEILTMIKEFKQQQVNGIISSDLQAQELAKILVYASIDKFKNPQGKKTPYQRKYKKTYNATWEGGKEDDITVLISVARRIKIIPIGQNQSNDNNIESQKMLGQINQKIVYNQDI